MKIPTISVSQFPEHTDSIAEPRPPTGPIPISFQDVGPKADLHRQAVPLPQNPIPLRPSLLEPEPDDGSPRKSAWVEPVHKSPNQIDLTPKPQSAYCKDSSYMQKHLETQNGCCMSVVGLSSDAILGEDKNLCSVGPGEEPPEQRREDSKAEPLEMDSSDEEVLARILRAQVPINKELFSIAEVTEEDDSCQESEEQKLQKSPQIPQKHKSSVLGKPSISSSAASCPTIPNCPKHYSTIASCHTHPAKNSEEPIYRLPSLDSTAHCATTLNSPTHGPHVSGDPVCGSLDPNSSAHCSLKSKCPTPQSKSLDIPVYQPPTRHTHWSEVAFNPSQSLISDGPYQYATSMTKSSSCALSSDCHFDARSKSHQHVTTGPSRKNPNVAHDHSGYLTIPQPRSKPKHRVHYSDIVDTITYQRDEYDSDSSIYISSKEARRQRRKSHKPLHQRGLPERGGDRLRREALLRSQRAFDNPPLVQYLDSKALVRTRVPVTSGIEIDVEYGTEDDDASLSYGATGVVVEQMSSEWWVEGGSSSIFEALRPNGQQSPRVLPLEMEAPNPRYCHTNRGASLGTRQRGPSGVGDLAEWRQDYHTPSTCAKPDRKARSYSTNSGDPRSLYGQSTPLRTTSGKTRAKARQLKDADGVRLASPECVEPEKPPCQDGARIFVALFSYDPCIMSPNPDTAEEELRFKEGQIIKVYGDKDQDGFYYGESDGRSGFVPSNMVSEIQVEDELTKAQLLQKGFLSPEPSMANRDLSKPDSQPQELIPSRMKAIFDYDPQKNSPNDDMEVELSFHAGDVISVYGNVDEDGFFYGELNGRRGLVPSNFLKTLASFGDQATPGPEQPEHQHEMPRLKQHPQKQRRKSVFALNPCRNHGKVEQVADQETTSRLANACETGTRGYFHGAEVPTRRISLLASDKNRTRIKECRLSRWSYQASSATFVFKGDHKPLSKMHPFWALPNEILRSLS
ncbi:hypothetical protein GJAV_G00059670 [Gymnothorax javanicus]|nr:hypothetical protein GJAV_G00059670 [Gymnothorax javanicus]